MGRGLVVMKKPCSECLFSDGRIVTAERRDQIVAECLEEDRHFLCHKGTIEGQEIMCAGFCTRYTSRGLRIAQAFGIVRHVDGPEAPEAVDQGDL